MDFKNLLQSLDQINEAKTVSDKGTTHMADPGGYGRKDDEDTEGKRVKTDAPKQGRGRPKKVTATSGEDKKYDFSAFGAPGKDIKLKPWDKKKTTSHKISDKPVDAKKKGLKEYFDQLEAALNEATLSPTQTLVPGFQSGGKVAEPTIIDIKNNPALKAALDAAAKQKQITTVGIPQTGGTAGAKPATGAMGTANQPVVAQESGEKWIKGAIKHPGAFTKKAKSHGMTTGEFSKDVLSHKKDYPAKTEKQAQLAKTLSKLSTRPKVEEADIPDNYSNMGAGLGVGRSKEMFEEQGVAEGLSDIVKGVKRKVAGKADPKEVEHMYGRIARSAIKHKTPDQAEKDIERYKKVSKVVNKEDVAEGLSEMDNRTAGDDRREQRANSTEAKAQREKEQQERLKKISPEMRKKLGLPEPKEGVAEAFGGGRGFSGVGGRRDREDDESGGISTEDWFIVDKDTGKMMKISIYPTQRKAAAAAGYAHSRDAARLRASGGGDPDMWESKKVKTKMKEGMDSRLKAAHHRGKSHALAQEAYNCHYGDMEEARQYHEGFKQGLDECYGQMPVQGYVGEESQQNVIDDMASFGSSQDESYALDEMDTIDEMEDMEEGNAFTGALAREREAMRQHRPEGDGKFQVGNKSFKVTAESNPFGMNEDATTLSWNNELSALLNENLAEGITVSSSQGQQGSPDSVSINATEGDAQQVLDIIRKAGLGLFGGTDQSSSSSAPMTVDTNSGEIGAGALEIDVVDDHDDMMSLIKKVTGGSQPTQDSQDSQDYEDEEGHEHEEHEGHEDHEEVCDACGSADCGCEDTEMVDEVESEDQMEFIATEDNAPDSDAAETTADENAEAAEDSAIAQSDENLDEETEEEKVEESYANGADDTFESDIDFMVNIITGGLNKKKSTGQTTIPVVASQESRLGNPMQESTDLLHDWKKLSGLQ